MPHQASQTALKGVGLRGRRKKGRRRRRETAVRRGNWSGKNRVGVIATKMNPRRNDLLSLKNLKDRRFMVWKRP